MYRPRRLRIKLFLLFIGFLFLSSSFAQSKTEEERTKAFEFVREMGRGANFMAAKMEGRFHSNHDFQLLKENHFTHCRIGGKLNLHMGQAPDYAVDADRIDDLKEAADMCLANGLIAVIDPLHLYNEHYSDDQLPALKKIWSQVAQAFASYPTDKLAFEIMNEPHKGYDLKSMIHESIAEIRKVEGNEERFIIVSGQGFTTRKALINAFDDDVFPTGDPYLIGTFHYYDPKSFTKQGTFGVTTHWGESGANDSDWSVVKDAFDEVEEANNGWAQRNQTTILPLYLGEYGVDNQTPDADRKRWLSWIRMQAEKRGYSTSLWNMYNLNSKGIGPWEREQKDDPSTRYFEQDVVEVLMTRYEMEDADLSGQLEIVDETENVSGEQYLTYSNAQHGDQAVLNSVYIPKSDQYTLTIRYKNQDEQNAVLSIAALDQNGNKVSEQEEVFFPSTADIEGWGKILVKLDLEAGEDNQIMLTGLDQLESLQLDYLCISLGEYHDRLYPAEQKEADVPTAVISPAEERKVNIQVYPTIFSNHTNIYSNLNGGEKVTFQVNDLLGRPVQKGSLPPAKSSLLLGQNYQSGYYLLNFVGEDWRKCIKLVKKSGI